MQGNSPPPFEDDAPIQSRFLLIPYDSLDVPEGGFPPNMTRLTAAFGRLSSSLVGDLSSFLVDYGGEMRMHMEAQQDCVTFFTKAVGADSNRNINFYGTLLYFMLLLDRVGNSETQVSEVSVTEIMDYLLSTVSRVQLELQSYSSPLEKFVVALLTFLDTRPSPLTRDSTESIYLHNYRTTATPNYAVFGNSNSHYAFRLESVFSVLTKFKILGDEFKYRALVSHFNKSGKCAEGKAPFYDLSKNGWPIASWVVSDDNPHHGR